MDHPKEVFTFASLPGVLSLGQTKSLKLHLSFYSALIKLFTCLSALFTLESLKSTSVTHTHTKVYRIINVPFSKPNCSWFIQPLLIDFTKAVYINSLMGPAFCTPRHYLREPGLFHSLASIFQLFFYRYVTNVVVSVVNDVCVCAGELQAAMWCSIKRRRCGLQTGLIRSPPSVSC